MILQEDIGVQNLSWADDVQILRTCNLPESTFKKSTAMRKGTLAIFLVFKINMKKCISWPPKWLRES